MPPAMHPIHRELKRRLSECRERRRLAAISPGNDEDFAAWNREVRRGEKLARCLIHFLTQYQTGEMGRNSFSLESC